MKTIDNKKGSQLKFSAFGPHLFINNTCINHGLNLPEGKYILERGIFILGHLETNKGNLIEAHLRFPATFDYHVCSCVDGDLVSNNKPIRLFPNAEKNAELIAPSDLFNPWYNCHGLTFANSEYWVNPKACKLENGKMVMAHSNVDLILDDEFEEVESHSDWDVAVFRDRNNEISHSVRRENNKIISKYDGYRRITFDKIEDVDVSMYGVGVFHFYKSLI
jgi:hypothetical protein